MDIPVKSPAREHRLAIVPGILGTVYALSKEGHAKYFGYDFEGAFAYAGVTPDADPRRSKIPKDWPLRRYVRTGCGEAEPGTKRCVWVR